ncbi:MAG TPA: hypothetical protein VFD43_09205, partial [Planctomycetota bacterium]|nr:hypothetical protein [Planctomycetota bacterium]
QGPARGPRAAGLLLAALGIAAMPALPAVAPRAQTPPASDVTPADATPLIVAGKKTTRGKVESQLSAPVRAALDEWAEAADRLELDIVLGDTPEHIVLGRARDDTLVDAAKWMDDTFTLLNALVPRAGSRAPKATVAILVDEKLVHSETWGLLLAELQRRRLLVDQAVEYLGKDPGGVTLRQTPLFLQPTYDLTGEGEFRLENEVVHKFAQCLLTIRTGQQPDQILWGLGYVVEQRLFGSSYHYRLRAYVWSHSHFDWKLKARKELDARRKAEGFSLAPFALDAGAAGKPEAAQHLVWAALSWLAQADPPALSGLLLELSAIQAEADPRGVAPAWSGDPGRSREALAKTLDAIEPRQLSDWLGQKPAGKAQPEDQLKGR